MTKIIYTLIRYGLTATGATEAIATDDLVMKIVSGIIALGSIAWGLYEAKNHAQLAASKSKTESASK